MRRTLVLALAVVMLCAAYAFVNKGVARTHSLEHLIETSNAPSNRQNVQRSRYWDINAEMDYDR